MNTKLTLTALLLCSSAFVATAQYSSKPPEVSPAPMKPEMTEIWEPEVKVVTPAKVLGDAPSDAFYLMEKTSING
jgi:hypothetical protein